MIRYFLRNADYLVALKPAGLCSERTSDGNGFCDLLAAENPGFLEPVYRLDREVGGVILYARTPGAAAFFSALVRDHALGKEYVAVLCGEPCADCGELRDLLFYDRTKNKSFVVKKARRGVKEAILSYQVLRTWVDRETESKRCAVSVRLQTGRTHQIRVQFASRGLPLLGDRRYGGAPCPSGGVSLFCRSVTLPAYRSHPAERVEWEEIRQVCDGSVPERWGETPRRVASESD